MTDYVISGEWLIRLSEIDYGNCDIANRIVARTLDRPLSDELEKERERVMKSIEEYADSLRDIESCFIKFSLKEIISGLRGKL